jgi:hypothetical protein
MNAYSQDLREKIVQALFERGMGRSEAARTFGVSRSSVKRNARPPSEGNRPCGQPVHILGSCSGHRHDRGESEDPLGRPLGALLGRTIWEVGRFRIT